MSSNSIIYVPPSPEISKGLKVMGRDLDGYAYLENGLRLDLVEAYNKPLPDASLAAHGLFVPVTKYGSGLNDDYRAYVLYYFNRYLCFMQQINTPVHPADYSFVFLGYALQPPFYLLLGLGGLH
jgi:hypothetical protein